MAEALVFSIEECSVFDGPGIRTTVFLKGCPLRCVWCHTPEGLLLSLQLMTKDSRCRRCGKCRISCSHEACQPFGRCLYACPDALIFPRMNVSLNEKWERENPDELCDEGKVELHRPCFSSDKWAEESMRLYGLALDHIEASDYADHVIGYQFAAGNTEESDFAV